MPVTVSERFESRFVTFGRQPAAELRYQAFGTTSEIEAKNAVLAEAPDVYDMTDPLGGSLVGIPLDTISMEPINETSWLAILRYGLLPSADQAISAFDTGGGTAHITNSRRTLRRYPEAAPDFKGAIGVTKDGVQGADIIVPQYHFSETYIRGDDAITNAYRGLLFGLTGRVNAADFKGLRPGECLFLGASGARKDANKWEVIYRFAGSQNEDDLRIGDLPVISKRGWELLWVHYTEREDTSAHTLVKVPSAAYVEEIYREGDFALMGIGV